MSSGKEKFRDALVFTNTVIMQLQIEGPLFIQVNNADIQQNAQY